MITVTIYKDQTGHYKGFQTNGHAGSAAYGKDIICAAVSMLIINTINSMDTLLHESFSCVENEDNGMIRLDFKQIPSEGSRILMDAMILGLNEVKHQYGKKYILLKFEEV